MRNFQDTFETGKRSFTGAFSICTTVPSNQREAIKGTQHHLLTFYQNFHIFIWKTENFEKIKWLYLFLSVTNITMVIYEKQQKVLIVKGSKFYPRWGIFTYFSNSNFLVVRPYTLNQRANWLRIGSYLMFSTVLASFTLSQVSFPLCLFQTHIFLVKKWY